MRAGKSVMIRKRAGGGRERVTQKRDASAQAAGERVCHTEKEIENARAGERVLYRNEVWVRADGDALYKKPSPGKRRSLVMFWVIGGCGSAERRGFWVGGKSQDLRPSSQS